MAVNNIPDPYTALTVVCQFLTTTRLQIDFSWTTAQAASIIVPQAQRSATRNRRDRRKTSEARPRTPVHRQLGGYPSSAPSSTFSRFGQAQGAAATGANGGPATGPTRAGAGGEHASKSSERTGSYTPRTGLCPFHLAGLLRATLDTGKMFSCEPGKNGDCGRKHAESLKAITREEASFILRGAPHKGLSIVADKAMSGTPRGHVPGRVTAGRHVVNRCRNRQNRADSPQRGEEGESGRRRPVKQDGVSNR